MSFNLPHLNEQLERSINTPSRRRNSEGDQVSPIFTLSV